ncbi:MAG: DUF542 domain-containing protein [Planctomycetota bacterium]
MELAPETDVKVDLSMTLAEIARRYPETLKVFARHQIELCCGSWMTLEEAARWYGLDLEELIEEVLGAIQVGL